MPRIRHYLGRFPFKLDYLHAFVILVVRCDVHILFREAIQILSGKRTLHDLSSDPTALIQHAHSWAQEHSEMLSFAINGSQMLLRH